MSRGFWFLAGASAGVYAVTKARRAAEAFTPDGLRDRLSGLAVGLHLLTDEVRHEAAVKEHDLRTRLGLHDPAGPPALEAGDRPHDRPHDLHDSTRELTTRKGDS